MADRLEIFKMVRCPLFDENISIFGCSDCQHYWGKTVFGGYVKCRFRETAEEFEKYGI